MEDFYDILVFQRLLNKLFEPEMTLPIETQLNDVTRQVVWEYSQKTRVTRPSMGHQVARQSRRDTYRSAGEAESDSMSSRNFL